MPETPVLHLPPGVADERGAVDPDAGQAIIDNRTGLPDELVREAVETHFIENASVLGASSGTTFQTYTNNRGSMLARSSFRTPTNVYDEIRLARDLAERDDDVAAVLGATLAVAYSDGMRHHHADERTADVFNAIAGHMDADHVFKELHREYLISAQVTTVALHTIETLPIDHNDDDTEQLAVAAPRVGVLPAENIRTIGNDLFGDAALAYVPGHGEGELAKWLQEFFAATTSPARKAEMRREDPVAATLYVEPVEIPNEQQDFVSGTVKAYRLNPRMVGRTTMPKGAWNHPRPLLTRNFAMLEAKRLLNIMDFALLQGGANFIVVAKKGDKDRPALPQEVDNLNDVVRRASKSGVIVGDHRLSFEIITPKLDELLNPAKRQLIGRKLAMALLRVPEHASEGAGQEGMRSEVEILARVITGDRNDIRRHLERHVYREIVARNPSIFAKGAAKVWFPKIILQGSQFFTDFVLKLRDRGDIPRRFAVEAAGFDWEAGVGQRKRELEDNIDETMAPAAVPFSSPNMGPQDNNQGRPIGSSPDNGAPGAQPGSGQDNVRPLRTINRSAGETVKAVYDEELATTVRVGAKTYAILEQYPEREIGRVTQLERDALAAGQPFTTGPLAIVPVNPGYEVAEVKAVRLTEGLSMLCGERRGDNALVAKALVFRAPQFDPLDAEERALRWGFPIEGWAELEEFSAREAPRAELPAPEVHIHTGGRKRKVVRRDEHGNIESIDEVPAEDEP